MIKIRLKQSKWREKIPGGLSAGKQPSDYPKEALKDGIKTELEHTSDSDIAVEIAMDHLEEDPKYYEKLSKMEKGVCEMKIKVKKSILKEQSCLGEECGDMVQPQSHSEPPPDFSGTPDYEGGMARSQMLKVNEYSAELMDMITPEMQLPAWVQSKLTKVADYMGAVKHFLEGEMKLNEKELSDEEIAALQPPKNKITQADILDLKGVIEEDLNEADALGKLAAQVAPLILPAGVDIDSDTIENLIDLGAPMLNAILAKLNLEESYIVEASCDDDKTMYEMELFYEECGCGFMEEQVLEEAEYQGRKVTLNKPMRGDVKKFKVYVKDPSTGNVKKVNFGDKNMRIKKSNPARRKSFRARHNCKNPGPKTKARYWSCRKWE